MSVDVVVVVVAVVLRARVRPFALVYTTGEKQPSQQPTTIFSPPATKSTTVPGKWAKSQTLAGRER